VANLILNNRFEVICNDLAMAFVVIAFVTEQAHAHLPSKGGDLLKCFRGLVRLENRRVGSAELCKIARASSVATFLGVAQLSQMNIADALRF